MTQQRFDLTDKTALVTGASSGLGAHFAHTLAGAGARVIVTARRTERLEALVSELQAQGHEALAVPMDVTDADSVNAVFDQAEQQWGGVDILVNNAGIGDPVMFLNMTEGNWRSMLSTNLDGAWRVAHRASLAMAKAGQGGSIINIASILGLRAGTALSHYAVAKAGVVQLSKSMALELARNNIRVNAIAPGYFRTEITAIISPRSRAKTIFAARYRCAAWGNWKSWMAHCYCWPVKPVPSSPAQSSTWTVGI